MEFRKVLIPTDFSPYSAEVLKRCEFLAELGCREVTLLHVVDDTIFDMLKSTVWQQSEEEIESMIEAAREDAESRLDEIDVPFVANRVVEVGDPVEKIAEYTDEHDLLYMGARGWHWKSRKVGDTALHVAEKIDKPAIFVKFYVYDSSIEYPFSSPFEKILFATDFSSTAERAKEVAKFLAKKASLTVLVVVAEAHHYLLDLEFEEVKKRAIATKKEFEGIVKMHIERGQPTIELPRIAEFEKPSMIVMGASGLERSSFGKTAEAVLKNCYGMLFFVR